MLFTFDHRRIAYAFEGPASGPVVCFCHSLASDGGMWAEQLAPLLAKGYRVLRIDMRGHGGSEAVAGDYTMDALADDVAAVLDFLGIAQAHFVGLSIGGMLGQAFALKHGHRLLSTVLCDTSPQSPPNAAAMWAPRIEAVRKAGSVAPLADGTMDRWFTPAFKSAAPGRWKQIHATIAATTSAGFLGCAAAIIDFDFMPSLPTIKVPALVICGAEDEGTPPAGNRRIAELIPGGRYVEIPHARHLPNVEQPEAFNRILLDWLSVRA